MFEIEEYNQHDLEETRYVVVDEHGMMVSSEHMTLEEAEEELADINSRV